MAEKVRKISVKWIKENRTFFRDFLDQTGFPDPESAGEHGPKFQYPEWLIMFIAVLSVKLKVKSYVQIHRMAMQYWDPIAADLDLKPISERQLRGHLKKICYHPRRPAKFIFQLFPALIPDFWVVNHHMALNQ